MLLASLNITGGVPGLSGPRRRRFWPSLRCDPVSFFSPPQASSRTLVGGACGPLFVVSLLFCFSPGLLAALVGALAEPLRLGGALALGGSEELAALSASLERTKYPSRT